MRRAWLLPVCLMGVLLFHALVHVPKISALVLSEAPKTTSAFSEVGTWGYYRPLYFPEKETETHQV